MIRSEFGKTKLEGIGFILDLDFIAIIDSMNNFYIEEMGLSKEESKEKIMVFVEKALSAKEHKPDEEGKEELKNLLNKMLDDLHEALTDALTGGKE